MKVNCHGETTKGAKMTRMPNQNVYASDKDHAQNTAKEQLKIILANKEHLLKARDGKTLSFIAEDFSKSQEPFTPKQLSFIDSIYEKTMKGAGFEAYSNKHDLKKAIRY